MESGVVWRCDGMELYTFGGEMFAFVHSGSWDGLGDLDWKDDTGPGLIERSD